jgi:hypothetical protein
MASAGSALGPLASAGTTAYVHAEYGNLAHKLQSTLKYTLVTA